MIKENIYHEYNYPDVSGGSGNTEGGAGGGGGNTATLARKLFTVTDNGVGKVLADLQGKALTENNSPSDSVIPIIDPVLMDSSTFGGTYRLQLHIQSPATSVSKFVWVPLLIAGYTEYDVNGEELRLGFDDSGPYYWYTATQKKYHFQIQQESSSDVRYQQYLILGPTGSGNIPSDIFNFTAVILWMPVVQSSLVHPTEILCFVENSQYKALTFESNSQQNILTKHNGYNNSQRHNFLSMTYPAFSVPLAISTINSSNQTTWNYFDWCQTSYSPSTLRELSVARFYNIAETDGQSTYLISGIYNGIAELLDNPTNYHIPLDNFLGAWTVPTSYWACSYGTIGFTPATNCVVTSDDVVPQVIVHNNGAMSVPTSSNYHIPNLLQGYILALRSDHFGYNPEWGLWKDNGVNFTSYNENGIQFASSTMCSYALTVLVTTNPQEYYNQVNTVIFENHNSTEVTIKKPNGDVIRTLTAGSRFLYTLESTGSYSFTTGASTASLQLTQNTDTGKVVTILGNSGSVSVMYAYPTTDI